jgi:hypothetical protein
MNRLRLYPLVPSSHGPPIYMPRLRDPTRVWGVRYVLSTDPSNAAAGLGVRTRLGYDTSACRPPIQADARAWA